MRHKLLQKMAIDGYHFVRLDMLNYRDAHDKRRVRTVRCSHGRCQSLANVGGIWACDFGIRSYRALGLTRQQPNVTATFVIFQRLAQLARDREMASRARGRIGRIANG